MPICYVYDRGCVYGHTVDGMKRHAMQTNPQVCFEVERVDDLTTWRSVIAWGSYEELTGDDRRAGDADARRPPDAHTVACDMPSTSEHTSAPHATVYRIRLVEKTGRFESRPPA